MTQSTASSHTPLAPLGDAYAAFRAAHPRFDETQLLDDLRSTEYARLDQQRQIYLDYTGAGLYATRQLRAHMNLLETHVFGNPHSENPTSRAMTDLTERARRFVLSYFKADPAEYVAIFTANASGALKLVGESYPFTSSSRYVLTYDNHNSVNGIREFARARHATVSYAPVVPPDLRLDEARLLAEMKQADASAASLFAFPAQSNFSGVQHPLEWIRRFQENGWDVLLDAAAFVPTNRLDLSQWRPDFVPLSFYKMFGYPTGVGCLLARKAALRKLRRPWFAGGAIWAASVESEHVFMADEEAAFEDGTINFLTLPAVEEGLRYLEEIGIEKIHLRVQALTSWLLVTLLAQQHSNGAPLARVYGPTDTQRRGATIALNFLDPNGDIIDERLIERRASDRGISLRTGCFCNPGAGELAFNVRPETIVSTFQRTERPPYDEFLQSLGLRSGGAVRVSLGLVTTFTDVYRFCEFALTLRDSVPDIHDLPERRHC